MKKTLWAAVGIEGPQQLDNPARMIKLEEQERNIQECLKKAAELYDVSLARLLSKNRKEDVVYVRQLICYLIQQVYGRISWTNQYTGKCSPSLKTIGAVMGGRDHTTIIHSIRTFQERLDTNALLPPTLQHFNRSTVQDYKYASQILKQLL